MAYAIELLATVWLQTGELVGIEEKTRGVGWAVSLVFALVVVMISGALSVRFGGQTLGRITTPDMAVHADFESFWLSARAFLEGGDVYRTGGRFVNLNPPFFALLMAPFGALPQLEAYRIFTLLMLLLTAVALSWMAQELQLSRAIAVPVAVSLLVSSPLLATLALGQVYPVLLIGLVAAWVAARREKDVLSGLALGAVVALKPSLAPVLLWPAVQRRWGSFVAALVSGAGMILAGAFLVGWQATADWAGILRSASASPYWDNASLAGAATRIFTENEFGMYLADLPWMVQLAYVLGGVLILLTVRQVRRDAGMGLWAMVAVSLLASPIAWHNYLVLLGPGILVLLARGRVVLALLLIGLQLVPPQWPGLWQEAVARGSAAAVLAVTLYLYILLIHWLALVFGCWQREENRVTGTERSEPGTSG